MLFCLLWIMDIFIKINKMSTYYSSGQEIINKYDPLYKPVFNSVYLYYIFNDEHDYEITENELKDENILVTLGHYYALEKDDINKAKYFYTKISELSSACGFYSLAVYYYINGSYTKARLYATNGHNMDKKCSYECLKLLFKIAIKESNYDKAEKYLIDEIEKYDKMENEHLKYQLIEELCIFYLNVKKNIDKLMELVKKNIGKSFKIRAIVAKSYYDSQNPEKLIKHAQILMDNNQISGNYFMGLHSYLLFILLCKKGFDEHKIIEESLDMLDMAEIWFESVIENDMDDEFSNEFKKYSKEMISKCKNIKNNLMKYLNCLKSDDENNVSINV